MQDNTDRDALVRMTGITKQYPGVIDLSDVDFELRPNEIHMVLGENGAGKSTLIKIRVPSASVRSCKKFARAA